MTDFFFRIGHNFNAGIISSSSLLWMYHLNSVHILLQERLMKCDESMGQKLGAEVQCSTACKRKNVANTAAIRNRLGRVRVQSLE
jgi:hypothetical protein